MVSISAAHYFAHVGSIRLRPISWGDGTNGSATVTGTAPTATTVNSLYTVAAAHTYAKPGVYQATVTVSASGATPITANFTVTAP